MNSIERNDVRELLVKVPVVITIYFWIVKILATTVGETGADYLIFDLHLGLNVTSVAMTGLLAVLLYAQVKSKAYVPWLYWMTVVFVSIVGTLITDSMTDNFGIPLETTTIAFSLALVATFGLWYLQERTLSIHSIFTARRELFYWAAILFTFALGTAAGDLVAESADIGYANSALWFGGAIAAISTAFFAFRLNAILAFWLAYILTRPLGAALGDYLSQPLSHGGLGLGTVVTSAVFLAAILSLVVLLTITGVDAPRLQADEMPMDETA